MFNVNFFPEQNLIFLQILVPDVNLDDVKETDRLAHFERVRPPTNRRRPARVATKLQEK